MLLLRLKQISFIGVRCTKTKPDWDMGSSICTESSASPQSWNARPAVLSLTTLLAKLQMQRRMARNDILPGDTVADDENEVGARPDLLVIMQEAAYYKAIIRNDESYLQKGEPALNSSPRTLYSAPPRNKFLGKFIKGSAMDPIYYDLFVAASVTEEGLRRMMHLPEASIENFFASLVPEATKFDRVLFVTAYRKYQSVETTFEIKQDLCLW
ncbi:hypothetical protein B0H15DRAFT_803298 [Mycena belliarum]|uniref:Uncharacterized protein n=1 Tax=Mycena belliarum TaxID=1033014 RepID=A0AAD6TWV4_9AGAR|nr:hypothetical protein B0H15DRAFT_803298 [Mycena belliae]